MDLTLPYRIKPAIPTSAAGSSSAQSPIVIANAVGTRTSSHVHFTLLLALLNLVTIHRTAPHRTCRNATTARDAEWPVRLLCLQCSPESDSPRHGPDIHRLSPSTMDTVCPLLATDTYHVFLASCSRAHLPPSTPSYLLPTLSSLPLPGPRPHDQSRFSPTLPTTRQTAGCSSHLVSSKTLTYPAPWVAAKERAPYLIGDRQWSSSSWDASQTPASAEPCLLDIRQKMALPPSQGPEASSNSNSRLIWERNAWHGKLGAGNVRVRSMAGPVKIHSNLPPPPPSVVVNRHLPPPSWILPSPCLASPVRECV